MKIKSDDKEVYIVSPLTVVLIVIAVAMLAAVIALYFVGKKAQKTQGAGKGGEIQLTDALKRLAKQQEVYAYDFKGHRYDVGSKIGFLQANIEFALRNPEVSGELKEYLDQLHGNMDAMLDYE